MNGQMKRGVLEMCVLSVVSRGEQYGYDILKVIGEAFPSVDRSTVYAVLRRLSAAGCASVRIDTLHPGPARKYYRLTPAGEKALDQAASEWKAVCSAVERLKIRPDGV